MKDLSLVNNHFVSSFRAFPFAIFFFMGLNLIIAPNKAVLYDFLVLLIGGGLSNLLVFKPVFKMIYNLYKKLVGVETLPFLGLGRRPDGAYGCSDFYICEDIKNKKLSTSFGMPSGHSQIAWTFSMYYIFELWKKKRFSFSQKTKVLQTIGLLIFSSIMSYLRVYVEGCHTLEQVIVGGLFGSFIGFLGSKYKSLFLKL